MKTRDEIKAMLVEQGYLSCEGSTKADKALQAITNGFYHLDGYTGCYEILAGELVVLRQKTTKLSLRILVIEALYLFFSGTDN